MDVTRLGARAGEEQDPLRQEVPVLGDQVGRVRGGGAAALVLALGVRASVEAPGTLAGDERVAERDEDAGLAGSKRSGAESRGSSDQAIINAITTMMTSASLSDASDPTRIVRIRVMTRA